MGIADLARRALGVRHEPRPPVLSFGSWSEFPPEEPRVVQICHPDWRGIRAAAYAFRSPVIECDDLEIWGPGLVAGIVENGIEIVVIQGWPPGSTEFARQCAAAGLAVKCVLHSSPALQGDSPAEAGVINLILKLRHEGVLRDVATVKVGVVEALAAIGVEMSYVPNGVPRLGEVRTKSMGPGLHVGVFGEPWWPKNITTQVLGALMIPETVVHITKDLVVDYLPDERLVVHGELPRSEFLSLLGSVDLNLYATFTECHPLLPIESYLLDVPCLVSPNSVLFRDDPELLELAVISSPDEPVAIAHAIDDALANEPVLLRRSENWIARSEVSALRAWHDFVEL